MIKNSLAGVAVKDFEAAVAWYSRVLERRPDACPMSELAEWKFASGGWLQVFADRKRAGSSSVTFAESDLDARVSELEKAGIEIGERSSTDYVKTAIIQDPDGNQIVFAEATSVENEAAS